MLHINVHISFFTLLAIFRNCLWLGGLLDCMSANQRFDCHNVKSDWLLFDGTYLLRLCNFTNWVLARSYSKFDWTYPAITSLSIMYYDTAIYPRNSAIQRLSNRCQVQIREIEISVFPLIVRMRMNEDTHIYNCQSRKGKKIIQSCHLSLKNDFGKVEIFSFNRFCVCRRHANHGHSQTLHKESDCQSSTLWRRGYKVTYHVVFHFTPQYCPQVYFVVVVDY